MAAGRTMVRARRQQPLRLIESGSGAPDPDSRGLAFDGGTDAEPIVLWRLGASDLDAGLRTIASGVRPAAAVVGINERSDVRTRARRLLGELGALSIFDPLVFKMCLPNYRTAMYLQELDYAPGRDAEPYQSQEFDERRFCNIFSGQVVGAQFDIGASGGVLSAAFAARSPEDPWLAVNARLLARSVAERDRRGRLSLLAPVIASSVGFASPEAQAVLLRALAAVKPEAFLLMLDGLEATSPAARQLAGLRLGLLLQELSAPTLLGRAGQLRYPFLAFGLAGIEAGLGRYRRFSLADYEGKAGGMHPPRFEFPSLLHSLPPAQAAAVLAAGVLPESECGCVGCRGAGPVEADPVCAVLHAACVTQTAAASYAGVPLRTRVERFAAAVDAARWSWHDVEQAGVELGRPLHLERWAELVDLADQAGLLEPGRLADELGLG